MTSNDMFTMCYKFVYLNSTAKEIHSNPITSR